MWLKTTLFSRRTPCWQRKFMTTSSRPLSIATSSSPIRYLSSDSKVQIDHHQSKNDDKPNTQQQPQQRSRRSRSSSKKLLDNENIPSYKEFVHRFTVLSLYRNFFKSVKKMPHNQLELQNQLRREFKSLRDETNTFNIQRAITEGKRRLEEIQEFTGEDNKYNSNSWINIQDPDDPRGRVGQGWPWMK